MNKTCPLAGSGCPLEDTGGCQPEYRTVCAHQAQERNMISPTQLHTLLKNGIVTVEFTKVDGSNRVMNATLNQSHLPEEFQGKGHLLGEAGSAHFSVYDVDAAGWRSFRLESVKSVKVNGVEYSPSRTLLTG